MAHQLSQCHRTITTAASPTRINTSSWRRLVFLLSISACPIIITSAKLTSHHPAAECRDRYLEPFSSSSIWNTAIGSDAAFAPTNLFARSDRYPTQFHNDQDFFLRVTDADPLTEWIDQGDWGADDHCKVTGNVVTSIHFPANFTTASDGTAPGQPNNNAMGVLLPDNETIVQMQPVYRCAPGSPLLARFGNATDGCKLVSQSVSQSVDHARPGSNS